MRREKGKLGQAKQVGECCSTTSTWGRAGCVGWIQPTRTLKKALCHGSRDANTRSRKHLQSRWHTNHSFQVKSTENTVKGNWKITQLMQTRIIVNEKHNLTCKYVYDYFDPFCDFQPIHPGVLPSNQIVLYLQHTPLALVSLCCDCLLTWLTPTWLSSLKAKNCHLAQTFIPCFRWWIDMQ